MFRQSPKALFPGARCNPAQRPLHRQASPSTRPSARTRGLLPALILLAIAAAVTAAPPNDECSAAIAIRTDEPFSGSTLDATGTDISTCGRGDVRDVWHTWRATCSGQARISLCGSNFDTVLAVYDGCGGAQLACNNDAPDGCTREDNSVIAAFPVTDRTRYWIRVSGASGETGPYVLTASCTELGWGACCLPSGECRVISGEECAAAGGRFFTDESCTGLDCSSPQPANDRCEAAVAIATDELVVGSSWNATGHLDSACGDENGRDVWHLWHCDCDGYADISLCESAFDTQLSIHDACDGAELACDDDSPTCVSERTSRLRRIPVTFGRDYLVRVSGVKGESGEYRLMARCVRPRRGGQGQRRAATSVRAIP